MTRAAVVLGRPFAFVKMAMVSEVEDGNQKSLLGGLTHGSPLNQDFAVDGLEFIIAGVVAAGRFVMTAGSRTCGVGLVLCITRRSKTVDRRLCRATWRLLVVDETVGERAWCNLAVCATRTRKDGTTDCCVVRSCEVDRCGLRLDGSCDTGKERWQ